jgi:SNF2 family DNA or RNA helicase
MSLTVSFNKQLNRLVIKASDNASLAIARSLPWRRFNPTMGVWYAPPFLENIQHLHNHGTEVNFPANGYCYEVMGAGKYLKLRVPPTVEDIAKAKAMPERGAWHADKEVWLVKPSAVNLHYINEQWPQAVWDATAKQHQEFSELLVVEAQRQAMLKEDLSPVDVVDYQFKQDPPPWEHQKRAFMLSRDLPYYAYLMEQGTGKTRVAIDNVCYKFDRGDIDAVLVVCPNSVKSNWEEEIPNLAPEDYSHDIFVWEQGLTPTEERQLFVSSPSGTVKWLIMNVEAFSKKDSKASVLVKNYLEKYRVFFALDESSKIKSNSANRTKELVKLAEGAKMRRIMTGTPITQGPLDAFTQFKFLSKNILGFSTYTAFKNYFTVPSAHSKYDLDFVNLEELQDKINPYSFRVLKEQCLDLPPKIYQRRTVIMGSEQTKLYKQLKDEMIAELDSKDRVTVTMVLTQLLRLQQLTGGFLTLDPVMPDKLPEEWDEEDMLKAAERKVIPVPGPNPKLEEVFAILEEGNGKAIIWARFTPEIELLRDKIANTYGSASVVTFYGPDSTDARTRARRDFQDPHSPVKYFVGQIKTGGIGLNLTQARDVIYYSNTFSLEDRLQSEDRAHRGGLKHSVTYHDIVAKSTVDLRILQALRGKKQIANQITGDEWRNWI